MTTKNFALFMVLAATAAGCGPSWTVVKQANPNPMMGKKAFAVDAVNYDGLMVGEKTEAAWLGEKKPEQVESFNKDKTEGAEFFKTKLADELKGIGAGLSDPGADVFGIKPVVTNYEPGSFNGFVNIATTVQMKVQFTGADGAVLDEVLFRGVTPADLYHPATGQRYRDSLINIGKQVAAYVKTRTVAAK